MELTLLTFFNWISENKNSLLVSITAAVVAGIILYIIKQLINNKREERKRKQQVEVILKQQEEEILKWRERRKNELRYRPDKDKELYYIMPYIKVIPIGNDGEEENGEAILLQKFFLDKENGILLKDPGDTFQTAFCILGDTGSGKTTALHYLYIDYVDQITKMRLDHITEMRNHITKMKNHITKMNPPLPIYFHYMSEDDVFDQIDKIENQKNCILLLDAIDENHMAQNPDTREQFMEKLGLIYKNFGLVVTTCRPQFYSTLQEEIKKVRIGGKDPWLIITRLRLQAFNKDQVNEYLHNVYSSNPNSLQKAEKFVNVIVSKDFKVEFRPLMLYYIEDFVNKNPEINSNLDLYDFIVKEQISRDIEVFSPTTENLIQPWWDMTSDVADYLYSKHKDHLTAEELKSIISKHNDNEISEWKEILQSINIALSSNKIPSHLFQQRSLLTRTGNEFHFSHRSIFEYFMAYRFLLYPDVISYVNGMDFALKLHDELLVDAYIQNKNNSFIYKSSLLSNPQKLLIQYNYFRSSNRIIIELLSIKHINQAELKIIKLKNFYQKTGEYSYYKELNNIHSNLKLILNNYKE